MLDLGLTKMALIGVVALVVLGPERLPRVARTAGALFGRAQRYINDVKAEVAREIELDHLRQMKTEFESAARNVENSIHDNLRKHESELNDAFRSGTALSSGAAAEDAAGGLGAGGIDTLGTASPWRTTAPPTVKRVSWRTKRTTAPVWYKRAVGRRTHVQSGAARVARHTPASLRKQRNFL